MIRPIQLGSLTIDVPIALGPMAGVTDLPFRLLAAVSYTHLTLPTKA